jgi:hypothetical protein
LNPSPVIRECLEKEEKEMRTFKIVIPAALALAVAVVLAVAGTASATVLCKVASGSSCGAGNQYGAGTEINSHLRSGEWAVMEAPGTAPEFVVHCTESTWKMKTTSAGGTAQTVTAATEVFSFGSCGSVPAPVVLKKPTLVFHWLAGNNATITEEGIEITVTYFSQDCVYGASKPQTIGQLTGGEPATIPLSMLLELVKGLKGVCPATMKWAATYEVTAPTPLYVTAS